MHVIPVGFPWKIPEGGHNPGQQKLLKKSTALMNLRSQGLFHAAGVSRVRSRLTFFSLTLCRSIKLPIRLCVCFKSLN